MLIAKLHATPCAWARTAVHSITSMHTTWVIGVFMLSRVICELPMQKMLQAAKFAAVLQAGASSCNCYRWAAAIDKR